MEQKVKAVLLLGEVPFMHSPLTAPVRFHNRLRKPQRDLEVGTAVGRLIQKYSEQLTRRACKVVGDLDL